MKKQLCLPRFSTISSILEGKPSTRIQSQDYLLGLRGILLVQSFLFVFFQTFLPAALPDSNNVNGPRYQIMLRKSFSVIFCNAPLIYSWIIFLSARTICIPYLNDTRKEICASSIFRRNIRLWIPTFVAFSLAAAAFSASDTGYIKEFFNHTGNVSTNTPLRLRNFLVYFNSMFDIFWVNKQYTDQSAVQAFPSGTLWIVSVLFQQSYTVYMVMIIVPHTRISWRVKPLLMIIVTAFWVNSWAWYSVTGLLIADAKFNMHFQSRSRSGFRLGNYLIPLWPFYTTMVIVGVLLQFLTISWSPEMRYKELYGHTGLYTDGLLNENVAVDQPWPRVDVYLIVLGTMLLIETFEPAQRVLRSKFLVTLGKRSISEYLVQSL